MKKLIGALVVVIFSVTLLTNTNTNDDLSLSSLIAMNIASAEVTPTAGCSFAYFEVCERYFFDVTNCYNSNATGDTSNCGF